MKAKSTYRLDGNFSAQLAELFRTNVVFILPPPYLTFVHVLWILTLFYPVPNRCGAILLSIN